MEQIDITKKQETDDFWKFLVKVGGLEDQAQHTVTVDREYWEDLTSGDYQPEELVWFAFEFLLKNESRESILKEFNLKDINNYFPEFEKEMKKEMM